MYHNITSGPTKHPVIRVGITDIHGQMESGRRIHAARRYEIESLGRFTVPPPFFRPRPGPVRHNIVGIEQPAGIILYPEFQLHLLLENTDEYRNAP